MKSISILAFLFFSQVSLANTICRDAKISDFMSEEQYLEGNEAMYCTNVIGGQLHNQPVFYIKRKVETPRYESYNKIIFTHSNQIPDEIIGRTETVRFGDLTADEIGELKAVSKVIGCYEFAYDKKGCISDSREPRTEFTFQKCGDRLIGNVRSFTLVTPSGNYPDWWVEGKPSKIECIRKAK